MDWDRIGGTIYIYLYECEYNQVEVDHQYKKYKKFSLVINLLERKSIPLLFGALLLPLRLVATTSKSKNNKNKKKRKNKK